MSVDFFAYKESTMTDTNATPVVATPVVVATLSAGETRQLDHIHSSLQQNAADYQVALRFHRAREIELRGEEKTWWQSMAEAHGIDISQGNYKAERTEAGIVIVQMTEAEVAEAMAQAGQDTAPVEQAEAAQEAAA